jgi:hypothetical protein
MRRTSDTLTVGIAALGLALLVLAAVALAEEPGARSPLADAARVETEPGFSTPPQQHPLSLLFLTLALGSIVVCLAVISWIKGEGFLLGYSAVAVSAVAVFLDHALLVLAAAVPLGAACEIAFRLARRLRG